MYKRYLHILRKYCVKTIYICSLFIKKTYTREEMAHKILVKCSKFGLINLILNESF